MLHRSRLLGAALLGAVALASSPARADLFGPWEQIRDEHGIVVHRRKVEGFDLHEFRGRGIVDAPLPRVIAVLADAPRRVDWMERCVASYEVEKIGETGQVAYNRTKGTWPVSDRDVVVYANSIFDVARREVRVPFHAVSHPKAPPRDGVVRIRHLRGHWILRPADGGRTTWVEYQAHADPGGSIPSFAVNVISKTLPYKTIAKLRAQVLRKEYPELERKLMADPRFLKILGDAGTAHPSLEPR